jgi:hypothetical protein
MKKGLFPFLFVTVVTAAAGVLCACGRTVGEQETGRYVTVIHADYPEYDTAGSLVEAVDLVFSGEVKSVSYELLDVRSEDGADSMTGFAGAGSIPYTIFEIEVSDVYKGDVPGTTVYLKRPGGTLDTGEYVLEGAAAVTVGRNYLFAAQTYEDTYPSFANATQSAYDLDASATESADGGIALSEILALFE